MDVRCTRCGIEYEFDDAKVTAAGVTVKCTSCGHVFKVKREEPSPAAFGPSPQNPFLQPQSTFARGLDGGEWMVKRTDGQVFRFKELTTLQKWIVERKVGRDDEISKTGKTWKKLGEIAELASFFQVVDAANAALQAGAVSGAPALGSSNGRGTGSVPPGSLPPGALSSVGTPGGGLPGSGLSASQPGLAAGPSAASFAGDPQPAGPAAPAVPVRATRTTGEIDARGAASGAFDALDDDDPVLHMIRRRRRNAALVTLLVVVAGCGAATAVFWPRVAPLLGLAPAVAAASPAVDEARKAIRADDLERIRAARAALAAASAPDARSLAWQARADVAIAAHAREQARLHDALVLLGALPPERAATAAKLRDEASAALTAAYTALTRARAEAPRLVDGPLASAAYQLEKGALQELRADLESARALARGEGGVQDVAVDAEIAALQALADGAGGLAPAGDPAAALARLPAGVGGEGDDGRLRSLRAALTVAVLERAALKTPPAPPTDADVQAARAVVEALPRPDARAELLLEELAALAPKAAAAADAGPAAVAADAGPTGDTGDAGGTGATAAAGNAPDPTGAGDDDEPNALAAASYEIVMQRAERARLNERSKVAFDLYTRATKLKPGAVRPWLGLGWAALDLGKNAEAIRAFTRALTIDDSLGDAQFGLAEAYNFSGKKELALEAYRTYLKLEPNGRDAAVARRAIDALD